jgi:hypothetical protein
MAGLSYPGQPLPRRRDEITLTPYRLVGMVCGRNPLEATRVMQGMMTMKKIDINLLQQGHAHI